MRFLYKIKGSKSSRALFVFDINHNVKFIDIFFPYDYVVLHLILLGYFFDGFSFFKFFGKLPSCSVQQLELF